MSCGYALRRRSTAFPDVLLCCCSALIPGHKIGPTAMAVAASGLVFTADARVVAQSGPARCGGTHGGVRRMFLVGLVVTFVVQLIQAVEVILQPADISAINTIAILVVVCFLIGIARAWELIGGPSIGITEEVRALFRSRQRSADGPADDESP